jgi:Spy/CpxP family protein refolding chaperone
MIATSLKGKILVFLIFFVGIAMGVLIGGFYDTRVLGNLPGTANRPERARRDVNSFHDYLDLTVEQREQVNKILEETGGEFRKLRKETQPQFDALQKNSQAKIRAVLTEEQRKKYDEFIESRSKRPRRRN